MPIPYDYSKDYLTIESLTDDNTISWVTTTETYSFSGDPISYSVDDGNTWNTVSTGDLVTLNKGEKVLLKGTNSSYDYDGYSGSILRCFFLSDSDYNIYGNMLSMFYGDNFVENTELGGQSFSVRGNVISAENLVLPSEFSPEGSLDSMFQGCTSLTTAPQLLATRLTNYCYHSMFSDCAGLITAPKLPATRLGKNCYQFMFYGCTNLSHEAIVPSIYTPSNKMSSNYCGYMYGNTPLSYDSDTSVFEGMAYSTYSPK